jgi:proline dehydrogenase
MPHKYLTADECFKSYKAYEAKVDSDVKKGVIPFNYAKALLSKAKKNYSRQNYNRELDKLNA